MSSRWNENSKSYDDFKVGDDLKQKLTESGMAEGAQDQTKPKLMDVVARETTSASPVDTHIIDLRFVFRHALRWSWVILVATAIGAASGLWDAHQFSRTSVAKMTVLPVESGGVSASQGNVSGGVGQLLGRLGGGIQTPTTSLDRLIYAASTISLARILQEKYGLMQIVFAGSWDPDTESWRKPTGEAFERREKINRFLNLQTVPIRLMQTHTICRML